MLTDLFDASKAGIRDLPDDDAVYWNLKHWGAPLAKRVPPATPLTLEETLAHGLALSRRDPDVTQVWPVVLANQRSQVNLGRLESLAKGLGQKRVLGFLLTLTGLLLKDTALVRLARRLHDPRVRRVQDFFLLKRGKRATRLAEQNTPQFAKEWYFRMNATLEGFQTHFDKFVPKS